MLYRKVRIGYVKSGTTGSRDYIFYRVHGTTGYGCHEIGLDIRTFVMRKETVYLIVYH